MGFKEFNKDLSREDIGNAIIFYGAEEFIVSWALNSVLEKFVPEENRSLDYIVLDGETATSTEICQAALSYSMFGGNRLICVKDYRPAFESSDAGESELLDLCDDIHSNNILIFTFNSINSAKLNSFGKNLLSKCRAYEFNALEKAELKSFIRKRFHAASKLISDKDLSYLIDQSGYYNRDSDYHLNEMNNDIQKIIAANIDDNISPSIIEEMMLGEADRYAFNLIDALMNNNKSQAMQILCNIEKTADFNLLYLLISQYEIMFDALELEQEGLTISEMAKITKTNEFRFKKAYQAATRFSITKIKDSLIQLYNIDKRFKQGETDVAFALEQFVAGF